MVARRSAGKFTFVKANGLILKLFERFLLVLSITPDVGVRAGLVGRC